MKQFVEARIQANPSVFSHGMLLITLLEIASIFILGMNIKARQDKGE